MLNGPFSPCPFFSGSCLEVYKRKAFDNTDYGPKTPLFNAIELGATSLMFVVHPTLTQTEIDKCCSVLALLMNAASKKVNQ